MYYSQAGEDEYLNNNIFNNKLNGKYIELGALDGILYSNTKFFEDNLHWSGVLIEPHPFKFQNLLINRPNNYLFNDLISCLDEEVNFRFFVDDYSGVSGIEKTLPIEHYKNFYNKVHCPQSQVTLKTKTLSSIIKQTNIQHFDLLSLDVEGHELEVLKSWDFSVPIDVILIETLGGSQRDKEEECRNILYKNNYKLLSKFKHNEIFILNNL
jgi:FkbM family methyltransferase